MLNEKLVLKDYSTYIEIVSNSYLNAKDYDESVTNHWESLNKSNHQLFKRLLSKVDVIFTTNNKSKVGSININGRDFKIMFLNSNEEYKTQSEMKTSFEETGILKISVDYSEHPYFSVEDNIIFRTVHDYIAHILGNYNFGGKGEIACYNLHAKMAPQNAIPALFTEVVGQAATTVATGSFPKQKIVILNGFDFYNVGVIDDDNYEIINKQLVKKGEEVINNKVDTSSREEPKAIHALDKDSEKELDLSHFIRKSLKSKLLEIRTL